MMKSRNLFCLLILSAAILGPGTAVADDTPTTSSTAPVTTDPGAATSPDTGGVTFDQEQIDAFADAANGTDDGGNAFEKASDFVTDNAPWFIIGIIVLAAITVGILIMRGRPAKDKTAKAAGQPELDRKDQPAQVPSASELRRRKRAAIQRSREEERMRRKAGIEDRKATRRGGVPAAPVAAAAGATAVTAATAAGLDPVEAEKQAARDQETAAAAVARFGAASSLSDPTGPVPAPVAPSQTAPAAGVVTPDAAAMAEPAPPVAPPATEPDTFYEPSTPEYEPVSQTPVSGPGEPLPEAQTSILHEPSIESPGPDAAVGNAAEAFLAGGAAGAAGGFAAAQAGRSEASQQPEAQLEEPLDPVIAPEPGMAPEHALADPEPIVPVAADETASVAPDDRLRAKVAEIKATQEPAAAAPTPTPEPEPGPLGPDADLSPGLAAVERKLSANSEERDRALRDAEERLRRVEQRAEDAERRAAFAERLAQLKVEESERERRLNDVVSGIDRAEQRAREAEARAEAAERAAASALEQSDLRAPEPPQPPVPPAPEAAPPAPHAAPPEPPAASPEPAPETPERKGLFGNSPQASVPSAADVVNLNSATFEELREAGLSVTQATRILAYRERFGGYSSIEDLEKVPGFPADLIESLRGRVTI